MLQKITEYSLINEKIENQFWAHYLQNSLQIDYLENKKRQVFLMVADFEQSFTTCIQNMSFLKLSMLFYIIKTKNL